MAASIDEIHKETPAPPSRTTSRLNTRRVLRRIRSNFDPKSLLGSEILLPWDSFLLQQVTQLAFILYETNHFNTSNLTIYVTGIFLISTFNLHARDIATPNLIIGVLVFFGGLGQFLLGIMEFMRGNTVSSLPQGTCSTYNMLNDDT